MVLHIKEKMRKNCDCCGRYFKPHPRAGSRQKCCGRPECLKKRNKLACGKWRLENPKYFHKRYPYLCEWRIKNPDYQKQWLAKRLVIQKSVDDITSINSITLMLPVVLPNKKIQKVVATLTVPLTISYDTMAIMGKIQQEVAISQ
jgi:hypothetical protein